MIGRIALLIAISAAILGCRSIRVYELDQAYAPRSDDPERKRVEERIVRLLDMAGSPDPENSYILNYQYLLIEGRGCVADRFEVNIPYAICETRSSGNECRRIIP
jgi:hypothetical protein